MVLLGIYRFRIWICKGSGLPDPFIEIANVGAIINRPLLFGILEKCPKIHKNTKMLISVAKKIVKLIEM